MMGFWNALEQVEQEEQGDARVNEIRKHLETGNENFKQALVYALSPDIKFGVKAFDYETTQELPDNPDFTNKFFNLLDKLANRDITGNSAREAVEQVLTFCSPLQAKWGERIVRKDLRLNVSARSVNKAVPGTIKIFTVPLATAFDELKPEELEGDWVVQPKLNGARCVAVVPPTGEIKLLSRTGKEWKNFESIRQALEKWRDQAPYDYTLYLDGEVVSIVNGKIDFNAIQQTMHAKKRLTEVGELQYIVWDGASEKEWHNPSRTYGDRLKIWRMAFGLRSPVKTIDCYPLYSLFSPDHSHLAELALRYEKLGFEGAMLRRRNKLVRLTKTKDIVKVKKFLDSEAQIVGAVEGNGRLQGTLGALECEWSNGVRFEIGSALDDKERARLWEVRQEIIGEYVNFQYFEPSKDGVPIYPTYRGIRHRDDFDLIDKAEA